MAPSDEEDPQPAVEPSIGHRAERSQIEEISSAQQAEMQHVADASNAETDDVAAPFGFADAHFNAGADVL